MQGVRGYGIKGGCFTENEYYETKKFLCFLGYKYSFDRTFFAKIANFTSLIVNNSKSSYSALGSRERRERCQ